MVSTVLASLGLLGVILVALHWALGAALHARRHVPAPLATLYALLDNWTELFNPERRADWRRRQRVIRARHQREAIARVSIPAPLDETPAPSVAWEGNVARPEFGRKGASRPHNLPH
jgi:hypothetical protein